MGRPRCRVDLLSRIRIVERTGSTNADLLAEAGAVEGDWLVARAQESGRGRQGRKWVSTPGNFFGSTIVNLRAGDPPAQSLSMAAGVALIRAVEVAAPATGLILKWPNDLLIGSAKLAGVLLERSGDRVVAGFGVNLAAAPEVPGRETAALASVALVSPQSFAPLLAAAFSRALDMWRSDPVRLLTSWMESAHPVGTELTVHVSPDEVISGRFAGIEPDGALRLQLESGETPLVRAGDVEL
ncbi:MAG: biotin--[acetyl-CoA-carboxylase] ligase [Pseudomonadota bacterium]|nr:biotin--[acetyl-CoA-carboxylase] ligase [Pseudomonadota bacterium]